MRRKREGVSEENDGEEEEKRKMKGSERVERINGGLEKKRAELTSESGGEAMVEVGGRGEGEGGVCTCFRSAPRWTLQSLLGPPLVSSVLGRATSTTLPTAAST